MAPVHLCARSVCCAACAVFGASWLLFTRVRARCAVPCVRCPGPLGPCSPVCSLGVLCCVCALRGHLAPGYLRARSVCCVACAVSGASWLLFTTVLARCAVLRVRCPGPLGSCSPVCLSVVCCRACGAVCAVSRASLLPFAGVLVRCVMLRVRRPGPLSSRSPVCSPGVLCCVCRVRGLLAPVLRCARSLCCVARAVFPASWLLFTSVRALCLVLRLWRVMCASCALVYACCLYAFMSCHFVVLRVRCPGPLGSCSPVCLCGVWCGVCGVLGHLAPVHRCARVACVVLRVRCPGPRGSCSPVCCALVLCVVCCVRCPGPHDSCSPVCLLGVLRGVCGVGVGVCSHVPYRPRCNCRRAQE